MKLLFLQTHGVSFSDIAPWMDTLPVERQAFILQFRRESDRVERLCAERLLRCTLCSRLGCEPKALRIARHRFGKPYLPDNPALHFSLSHTKGAVLAAISDMGRIGADCERRSDAPELVDGFATQEQAFYRKVPPAERPTRFTSLWTRKEAYGKCIGTGLSDAVLAANTCAPVFLRHVHQVWYQGYLCTVWAEHPAALRSIEWTEVRLSDIC